MKPVQLALELKKIIGSGKCLYLKCEPEVLDFTSSDFKGFLAFYSKSKEPLRVPLNVSTLISFFGILNAAIFDDKDFIVICWNIKSLFSFLKYHTKALLRYECKLIDLKLMEHFLGIRNDAPKTFVEAIGRMKIVASDDSYVKAKEIYGKIHVPLFSEVIPFIETNGLYNKDTRIALYPCYEIEGAVNGRMKCSNAYRHCFMPHTIGPQDREVLKPKGMDEVFIYFDYKNMEVSMLQWLTKDDRLEWMLNLQDDFYKVLFKLISGIDCDNDTKREMSKSLFLPVVYGKKANTLAKELNVAVTTASKLIDRIYKLFPKSFSWIDRRDANCIYSDYFGRKRYIEEAYKVRNFLTQSPASIVCLEKLIKLFHALSDYAKLVCHIHDGYVVTCSNSVVNMVSSIGKDVLESDSELCSGMKLRVTVKTGDRLSSLSELPECTDEEYL